MGEMCADDWKPATEDGVDEGTERYSPHDADCLDTTATVQQVIDPEDYGTASSKVQHP